MKKLLKSAVKSLARVGSFDVRLCQWRLESLGAEYSDLSGVTSMHDAPGQPNARLLDLVPTLFARARAAKLPLLDERSAPAFALQWPGGHYKLLVALIEEVRPRSVVEIGTFRGLSALAMLPALAEGATLTTFDILSWDRIPGTYLRAEDFASGRLVQHIADLGDGSVAARHGDLLRHADLVFVDAAKDGELERRILTHFATVRLRPGTLVLFDDIRLWNMLAIWREIAHPKLDLTSLGNYCGTGLVEWSTSQ